jgi:hypothetical protein
MTSTQENDRDAAENLELTQRLTTWLRSAGIARTTAAVDLADVLAAAKRADTLVRRLLKLKPDRPQDADEALRILGQLRAWLITEMKPHLDDLEKAWPILESRIERLGSAEGERT